jgi:uncharacterized protein YndB with AHSA1/START domain
VSENFTLDLTFNVPVNQLYQALASKDGPSRWWSKFCETSDTVGGVSKFRFPKAGFYAHMEIADLKENKLVEWKCVDSRHPKDAPFSDLRDWVGTMIRFQCELVGDGTSRLQFEHVGLTPVLDCYETCQSGWSYYLGDSLRALLETGEGKPYTDDSEDNI